MLQRRTTTSPRYCDRHRHRGSRLRERCRRPSLSPPSPLAADCYDLQRNASRTIPPTSPTSSQTSSGASTSLRPTPAAIHFIPGSRCSTPLARHCCWQWSTFGVGVRVTRNDLYKTVGALIDCNCQPFNRRDAIENGRNRMRRWRSTSNRLLASSSDASAWSMKRRESSADIRPATRSPKVSIRRR